MYNKDASTGLETARAVLCREEHKILHIVNNSSHSISTTQHKKSFSQSFAMSVVAMLSARSVTDLKPNSHQSSSVSPGQARKVPQLHRTYPCWEHSYCHYLLASLHDFLVQCSLSFPLHSAVITSPSSSLTKPTSHHRKLVFFNFIMTLHIRETQRSFDKRSP